MIGITLKHLRYFDALARQGHFGRAAETCGISQPALSVQIKELEGMLGVSLVERGARTIRLTAAGEDFLERARKIVLAVDDLADFARMPGGLPSGRIRMGAIPTVAPYFLPRVIGALSAHFPKVDLHPREALTDTLVAGLLESQLDLALVALPVSEPRLREFALFDEDFVLVRPAKDEGTLVPGAAEIGELRLLLLEEGHCFRDQALSFCNPGGGGRQAHMEGNSLTTLVQMVAAGLGVTLIPEMAIPLETRSAEVSIVRFPAPRPKRTVGLVWRRTNPLSEQFMQLGAVVRAAAQSGRPAA